MSKLVTMPSVRGSKTTVEMLRERGAVAQARRGEELRRAALLRLGARSSQREQRRQSDARRSRDRATPPAAQRRSAVPPSSSSFSTSRAIETTLSSPSMSISRDALRRAADGAHVVGRHAEDHALLRDHQQLVAFLHVGDADDLRRCAREVAMLMTPTPPRDWTRYSSISVRLP